MVLVFKFKCSTDLLSDIDNINIYFHISFAFNITELLKNCATEAKKRLRVSPKNVKVPLFCFMCFIVKG